MTIFPTTNAVYDGRMAVFNCSTYRFDSLQWAMDDDLVAVVLGMNSEVTITKDGVWLHSSLVVPAAQLVHNDSKITCIGNQLFSETSQNQRKDSQFYVQGKIRTSSACVYVTNWMQVLYHCRVICVLYVIIIVIDLRGYVVQIIIYLSCS